MDQDKLFKDDREQITVKTMELFNLPPVTKSYIDNLLNGKIDESLLICCHSDCSVCQQTIHDCLQEIKKQLG